MRDDFSLIPRAQNVDIFSGNQFDQASFNPLSFWLACPTETHSDNMTFYVPILCMSYAGLEDNYGSRDEEGEAFLLKDYKFLNSRIELANFIIKSLHNSYFAPRTRYSKPKRVFEFSAEAKNWLEVYRDLDPPTLYYIGSTIKIAGVFHLNNTFSSLLQKNGFVVKNLPIYRNEFF